MVVKIIIIFVLSYLYYCLYKISPAKVTKNKLSTKDVDNYTYNPVYNLLITLHFSTHSVSEHNKC